MSRLASPLVPAPLVPVARIALLGIMAWAAAAASATAQETVNIEVPFAVSFPVTDVTSSTSGTPTPVTISFSNATLIAGRALRVSVQADAAAFTPPRGPGIPASHVSWTTVGASGGAGSNGTLSSSSFALVFQSDPAASSGHVDLAWTLMAPGSGIRAGLHQLTIRWKVESISP
jgi:hypothetical protein